MAKIKLLKGDITKVEADAIINDLDNKPIIDKGLCKSVFEVAGEELREEYEVIGYCEIGEVKLTRAYNLKNASWIIHTMGPKWQSDGDEEYTILKDAYINSLSMAVNYRERYMSQCIGALDKYIISLSEKEKYDYKKIVEDNIQEYIVQNSIESIAIPAISCGMSNFPLKKASYIAINTAIKYLMEYSEIKEIIFVAFDEEVYDTYKEFLVNLM